MNMNRKFTLKIQKTNKHIKNINFTNESMENKIMDISGLSNQTVFLKIVLVSALGK